MQRDLELTMVFLACAFIVGQNRVPTPDEELLAAIRDNSVTRYRAVIGRGANVFNPGGQDAVVYAARRNSDRVISSIIFNQRKVAGMSVFVEQELGNAAVVACSRGHVAILRALLDGGLSPSAMDSKTPYIVSAAVGNHFDCFRLLLQRGASATASGRVGFNAIDAAWASPSPNFLKELSVDHESAKGMNLMGRTPLFYAVRIANGTLRHSRVARLIELGCDASAVDKIGQTAINNAMHDRAVIRLLCSHGADVNRFDVNGLAPIHYAAKVWDESAWVSLVQCGACATAKTSDGHTSIEIARSNGFTRFANDIQQFLERSSGGKAARRQAK